MPNDPRFPRRPGQHLLRCPRCTAKMVVREPGHSYLCCTALNCHWRETGSFADLLKIAAMELIDFRSEILASIRRRLLGVVRIGRRED